MIKIYDYDILKKCNHHNNFSDITGDNCVDKEIQQGNESIKNYCTG